uniref:MATE family efflux transporter n=1 Tax=Globodera pallida TaxID=36090 RepID=A0A183CLE8_GLOPA
QMIATTFLINIKMIITLFGQKIKITDLEQIRRFISPLIIQFVLVAAILDRFGFNASMTSWDSACVAQFSTN